MPKLSVVLCLALAASARNGSTSGDKAATAIATPCDEELYLEKLKTHIMSNGNAFDDVIQELQTERRKLSLATAAAEGRETRCLLSGLQAVVTADLASNQAAATRIKEAVKEAREALEKQLQTAKIARALYATKTIVDPGNVHTNGLGNSHKVKIVLKTTTSTEDGCKPFDPEQTTQINKQDINIAQMAQLKLTDNTQLAKAIGTAFFTATAQSACNHNGKAQNDMTPDTVFHSCTFGSTGNAATINWQKANYAAGPLSTVNIFTSDSDRTCHSSIAQKTKSDKHIEYLGKTLCTALTTPSKPIKTSINGPSLKNNDAVLRTVAACTPKFSNLQDPADNTKNSALKAYVEKAYGTTNGNFKATFENIIDKKSVPIKTGATMRTKTIDQVATDAEAEQILSHLELQRSSREEAAKPASATTAAESKKAKECKEERDEDKCNEKDGCEFKNGECKLKDGVKAEEKKEEKCKGKEKNANLRIVNGREKNAKIPLF
uniref:Variant surface glycoprotein 1125.1655 n=1 Tax=Trypanosoma brucei TaxID=5691 RepID=A0A1J0R7G4_9TRYP|nr:variant surface glycoprotein 1125.1655 [Trypanosoma brucei]